MAQSVNLMVLVVLFGLLGVQSQSGFTPSSFYHCMTNDHCNNTDLCCSWTAALGRRNPTQRQVPPDWDGMVHYCLPWKTEDAAWCELRMQYSTDADHYMGLCPCGPGLKCVPSNELDPAGYPHDRFGKCVPS